MGSFDIIKNRKEVNQMVEVVKNCVILYENDSNVAYQAKCDACESLGMQFSAYPQPPGTEWKSHSTCPNCGKQLETILRFL